MPARRAKLPKTARLLASASNPCMDLIVLLCMDSAPPLASVGPPGLTPAQLAMRQKMLAFQARRMGVANPAAGAQQQPGVRRGPQIKLALWRTGQALSPVWEVDVALPAGLFPHPAPSDVPETVRVADMCWSPDGERVALRVFATRGETHASAVLLYAVDDGKVLATRALPCAAPGRTSMQWLALDTRPVASQALQMLATLAPLPELAPVGVSSGTHARMLGARAAPPTPLPSTRMACGEGVLAQLPALHEGDKDKNQKPTSLLCVLDGAHTLHGLLDGSVWLGACSLSSAEDGALVHAAPSAATVLLARDGQLAWEHVALPLDDTTTSTAVMHLAALSTSLRHALAHATDAVACAEQAWRTLARPRALEWQTQLADLAQRYAVDLIVELMTLVMTGRGGHASEQLLLHNLTEGATIAMEQDARRGLKLVRRYAGTTLVPACEHALLLLHELQGCAAWPERYARFALSATELAALVHAMQTCHALAFALQEQAERELLALDEFFKWWRMEQDRQERLKTEDTPRTLTTHDTLTVLELLRRGFVSPELDALLGAPASPAPPPPPRDAETSAEDSHVAPVAEAPTVPYSTAVPPSPTPSIADAVQHTLAWLDTPRAPRRPRVYDVPQLFVGPEHAYDGPRALPGDAQPLAHRLQDVGARVATVLATALARTLPGAAPHATPAPPVAPLHACDAMARRDDTWCSLPAEVRAVPLAPLLVRSHPPYTVLWEADCVHIFRADGQRACLAVPGVRDCGFAQGARLVILHQHPTWALGLLALDQAHLFAAAPRRTPVTWLRTVPLAWEEGEPCRLAVQARSARCMVLGSDAQTLASVVLA